MSAVNFQADGDLAANIPISEINKIISELIEILERDSNACELFSMGRIAQSDYLFHNNQRRCICLNNLIVLLFCAFMRYAH